MLLHHGFEEIIVGSLRSKLAMDDLESIRHRIVVSSQSTETSQNRIVNSFDKHHFVKGVEFFLLKVVIPLYNICGHLEQIFSFLILLNLAFFLRTYSIFVRQLRVSFFLLKN